MTGDLASTKAAENAQTKTKWKRFSYSNQSLIAQQSLFWINPEEIVTGEVASVFEKTKMYG